MQDGEGGTERGARQSRVGDALDRAERRQHVRITQNGEGGAGSLERAPSAGDDLGTNPRRIAEAEDERRVGCGHLASIVAELCRSRRNRLASMASSSP